MITKNTLETVLRFSRDSTVSRLFFVRSFLSSNDDLFYSYLYKHVSIPMEILDNEATLYSDDDLMPQAYNECVPVNSIKREPSKRVGLSRLSKSFQPTYSNHTRDCARFESGQVCFVFDNLRITFRSNNSVSFLSKLLEFFSFKSEVNKLDLVSLSS